MSRVSVLLWTILCVYLPSLICQGQPYYFKHFETDDGLVNNSITAITQDHHGFVWIGTRGGLMRFDGYSFKSFNNRGSNQGNFWNNFITSIAEDKNGILWIGTGRGIFKYDPIRDILRPVETGPQAYINGFVIDAQDRLWILGQNRLYCYDQRSGQIENLGVHASRVALNFDGNLLLSNYDGLLFTCNINSKSLIKVRVIPLTVPENMRAITDIYPINEESIFIGYKQGLVIYNLKNKKIKQVGLHGDQNTGVMVRDICLSKGDEYWIATESGLYIYNLQTDALTRLSKKQGDPYAISDNAIYSVFKDKVGDMWVGTYFGGLNYHAQQNARFEKYYPTPIKNSLSGNAVSEIWADKSRFLYIATEDAGLNRMDIHSKNIINYSSPKLNNNFYSNIHSLAGLGNQLFIGSYYHGMQVMDRRTAKIIDSYKIVNAPEERGSDFVLSMYAASDINLFVGTTGDYGGLYQYHPAEKTFSRFKEIKLGNSVYHIIEDSQGVIWAGLKSQTAYHIDPKTGKSGKIVFGDPANESSVHYIFEDSSHALWFSTVGAGLIRLSKDRKTFKKYTIKDGLPSDVLFGILEDDSKRLWVGSSNGLVCFDLISEKIIVYTQDNGLITNQFNFNSACKTNDGTLYFGSVKGLIAFNPLQLLQKEAIPQIYFTNLQINNIEVNPGQPGGPLSRSISHTDTLVLSANQRNFSLEFAALNFSAPKATRYRYQMVSLDRNWSYSNFNRIAYFTDLSPGSYILTVRATSNVGTWTSKERKLFIEVLPPVWQSKVAYFVYAVIFSLSLYAALKWYHAFQRNRNLAELRLFEHQKQKEVYKAKIEFFTHIAHEIQTPLTLISIPLSRTLKNADDYPPLKKNLLMINKYTRRLIDLTSQLLDFRQTEIEQFGLNFVNVQIGQLLAELVDSFMDLASEENIALKIILPKQEINAFVDREAFSKICNNLINNAIKYADKAVSIELSVATEMHFTIAFENDGKEIPQEYRQKIFQPFFRLKSTEKPGTGIGLSLANSLTELHNGTLQLVSGETNRIIFVLNLPIHQQYEFYLDKWKKIDRYEQ